MNLFLRKITGSGVELNIPMGDEGYTFIHKEINEKEFNEMKKETDPDWIYAFIVCGGGATILPLSNKQKSYVMTETGKTFANVSQR